MTNLCPWSYSLTNVSSRQAVALQVLTLLQYITVVNFLNNIAIKQSCGGRQLTLTVVVRAKLWYDINYVSYASGIAVSNDSNYVVFGIHSRKKVLFHCNSMLTFFFPFPLVYCSTASREHQPAIVFSNRKGMPPHKGSGER